jgi:hypothetical protein
MVISLLFVPLNEFFSYRWLSEGSESNLIVSWHE